MRRAIWPAIALATAACAGPAIEPAPPPVGGPTTTSPESVAAAVTTTPPTTAQAPTTTTTEAPTTTATTEATTTTTTLPAGVTEPPEWLGTRSVEYGVALPTPPELSDRRFVTHDRLPPPTDGFEASFGPVPAEVAARSTWSEECPVALEDLAYLTVAFRGFDGRDHMGELIVAVSAAEDLVGVFQSMYEGGFPIEEMGITSPEYLEAQETEPTGDGNLTESFVCRSATGGTGWSQHAFGLAVDINPFHNPYLRGDVLIPELATDYLDRDRVLPGMIIEGDVVTQAFDAIGWGWGGRWSTLDDWQHFSHSGR